MYSQYTYIYKLHMYCANIACMLYTMNKNIYFKRMAQSLNKQIEDEVKIVIKVLLTTLTLY